MGHLELTFHYRVYWEDTDAAAVMYYANYLKFIERARSDWLRVCGYSQTTLLKTFDLMFMVFTVQSEFHASAHLDDLLTVSTQIDKLTRTRVFMRQIITHDDLKLFSSSVVLAAIHTYKRRPIPIPTVLYDLFNHHLLAEHT